MKKVKFTTVALKSNQYLLLTNDRTLVEIYCYGYTDGKRDKSLHGYYFRSDLMAINGRLIKQLKNS